MAVVLRDGYAHSLPPFVALIFMLDLFVSYYMGRCHVVLL